MILQIESGLNVRSGAIASLSLRESSLLANASSWSLFVIRGSAGKAEV